MGPGQGESGGRRGFGERGGVKEAGVEFSGVQRSRASGKFRGKEMEEGGRKREDAEVQERAWGEGLLRMSAGEGGSIKLSQQRGAVKFGGASDG